MNDNEQVSITENFLITEKYEHYPPQMGNRRCTKENDAICKTGVWYSIL